MAELTFKSAGVSTREIDLSGPTAIKPQGVPAGIIGTSQKGPAFVPVTVATWKDFVAEFGGTDGKKFGPLAMNEWMKNARAGTYVRVLGVGDAAKRDSSTGRVTNAGFVVGGQLPQDTDVPDGGLLGVNPYGGADNLDAAGAPGTDGVIDTNIAGAGRTYFLGGLYREEYAADGEAAAELTLTIDTDGVLQADSELARDGDSANLRLEDSAGEHLMLHFHAGPSDGTNADGVEIDWLDSTRNLWFTIGEVATLTLTVADNTDIDNRSLTITDKSGNTHTRVFQMETDAGLGTDYSANPAVINIGTGGGTGLAAVNDIAAEIRLALLADATDTRLSIEAPGGALADVELTMTAVGEIITAGDHIDGDADTQGNITAASAGGLTVESDALATAIAAGISGAGMVADLTASADGGVVTVSQGTVGTDGNTASHENSDLQIASVQVAAGTPGGAGDLIVFAPGLNDGATERKITIDFVDGPNVAAAAAAGDWAASVDIRDALPAEVVLSGTDNEAHFHDGQSIVVHDGTTEYTITVDEAGLEAATMITGVTLPGLAPATAATITWGTSDIDDNLDAHFTSLFAIIENIRSGDILVANAVHDADANPATDSTLTVCIADDADTVPPVGDWASETLSTGGVADDAASITIGCTPGAAGNAFTITNDSADSDLPTPAANDGLGADARSQALVLADVLVALQAASADVDPNRLNFTVQQGDADGTAQTANDIHIRHGLLALDTGVAAQVSDPTVTGDWVTLNTDTQAQAGALGTELDAGVAASLTLLADHGGSLSAATEFAGGGDATEGAISHTYWRDAGYDTSVATGTGASVPFIRAVLMTPAGVRPTLACDDGTGGGGSLNDRIKTAGDADAPNQLNATGQTLTDVGGSHLGLVTITGTQERITLLLNGHIGTSEFPDTITCSLDPQAPDYFMNVLNHDPACMEKAGHYVYAHYNVYQDLAAVDGTGHTLGDAGDSANSLSAAFLVSGKNTAGASAPVEGALPNYEDFQDRFQTARSPWVISQVYGSKVKNLFRIHALDDGEAGSGKFKISISNVLMNSSGGHGTFDLSVRDISDDDISPRVYEKFLGLDLNPQSDRYIARVIGDQYMYYDFDKRPGSQKLVVDGIHSARSKYIRVEMDPRVNSGGVPADALPMGYRGYYHLNTDANEAGALGVRFLEDGLSHLNSLGAPTNGSILNDAVEPPVPVRFSIATGSGSKKRAISQLHWGTHFQVVDDITEPNKNTKFDESILSYGKYFPTHKSRSTSSQPDVWIGDNWGADTAHGDTSIQDADVFNNNLFSLERVQIITKQPSTVSSKNPNVSGKVDHKQWAIAEYRRDGLLNLNAQTLEGLNIFDDTSTVTSLVSHADVTVTGLAGGPATLSSRFLDPQTDCGDSSTRRFMKFSFFLQGGFDGTNIFNKEKRTLSNRAAVWEMDDANQGGVGGATVASFRKAIDVMAEKADVDIKLLTIPGMRDEAVTDYAIDAVEDRFDAMYIMDIEERAVNNDLMIDYSTQKPSVNLTVEELSGRNLDSSFAAVYFPDVVITDPALGTNIQCPPSVAVLGAFSLNDSVAHPWFAPAGFSRGALKSVVETQVKLNRANLDTLYESDVNPLAAFPHTPGVVVWGQKTLQQAQSALDRVNVRRLLIEIRREVRRVGNGLLFEPNREETLGRFSAAVNPILQRIQQQQGLDKFKVVIDTTTTTQADIENNTVRGKIFLQPTRTVEFISLDFVVTNAGMEV